MRDHDPVIPSVSEGSGARVVARSSCLPPAQDMRDHDPVIPSVSEGSGARVVARSSCLPPAQVPRSARDDKLIVCVDLNGVLDAYGGWQGPEHWDPPREGAAEFLGSLREHGFRVVIFTTRFADDAKRWLVEHDLLQYVDEVTDRKPAAHVFVDDRAVCFRGDFDATLNDVLSFSAHWENQGVIPSREDGEESPAENVLAP